MHIVICGLPVHYKLFGKTPNENTSLILFLHGWGRMLDDFDSLRVNLEEKLPQATFIQFDLPGFGGSPMKKEEGMSIAEYAHVLKNFLEKIGSSKATFVGHSFGGKIAVKFASLFPERIEKLVLISAAGLSQKTLYARITAGASSPFRILLFPFQHTRWMRRMKYALGKLFGSSDYRAAFSPALRETLKKNVGESSKKDAEKITHPTLIIWGKDDIVTPLVDGKKYHSLIRGSNLTVLPDCGHFPFLKHPEKCADLIALFLTD